MASLTSLPPPYPSLRLINQGFLTFKDMVMVNLPNNPSQYPAGLLSCMPWYLAANFSAAK